MPHRKSLCALSIGEVQDTAVEEKEGLDALKGARRGILPSEAGWAALPSYCQALRG